MIKSFRLRLTLWYLACFALLFSFLTAALYGVLSRALIGRLDETLVSQAATAASLFQDEMEETGGDLAHSAREAVTDMRLRSSKAAVVDGQALLAASSPFDAIAIVRHAGARRIPFSTAGMRVAIHRLEVGGHALTAIAAEPLDGVEQISPPSAARSSWRCR